MKTAWSENGHKNGLAPISPFPHFPISPFRYFSFILQKQRITIQLRLAQLSLFSASSAFETENLLELIVQDEYQSTTGTTNGIREGALEEGTWSFLGENLLPAVEGGSVQDFTTTSLHHHATTDRVEGIRNDTSRRGHSLSQHPGQDDGRVLGVFDEEALGSVETTKEGSAVDNDTSDTDTETAVQSFKTVLIRD